MVFMTFQYFSKWTFDVKGRRTVVESSSSTVPCFVKSRLWDVSLRPRDLFPVLVRSTRRVQRISYTGG